MRKENEKHDHEDIKHCMQFGKFNGLKKTS